MPRPRVMSGAAPEHDAVEEEGAREAARRPAGIPYVPVLYLLPTLLS